METNAPAESDILARLRKSTTDNQLAMHHAQQLEENVGLLAHERLASVDAGLPSLARAALTGDADAEQAHASALAERGRLHRTIGLHRDGRDVAGLNEPDFDL